MGTKYIYILMQIQVHDHMQSQVVVITSFCALTLFVGMLSWYGVVWGCEELGYVDTHMPIHEHQQVEVSSIDWV